MAHLRRRTAVVGISSPNNLADLLALDVQRRYSFVLKIDGRQVAGGVFESPLGDEAWRNVVTAMREATEADAARQDQLRRQAETIKDAGRKLFRYLVDLSPELQAFLATENEPRRLVILSARPEIHLLPWEAMVDSEWKSVAEKDLSVVHSLDTFEEEKPVVPSIPLTIEGVFGPGTEKRTRKPLLELAERAAKRGGGRIIVHGTDDEPWALKGGGAQVVQLEAHGDPETGELDLGGSNGLETSLADALHGRAMVLLWSCFSALVHSWGESLGLKLHRQKNTFVLGFATPLRFDTSGEIATRFYSAVFGDRSVLDPETAVVRERSWLFTHRVRACEWAALTLWLQSPVDLGGAIFQGPRLLGSADRPSHTTADDRKLLKSAVQQALPGRTVMLTRFGHSGRLATDLFDDFRGAVVHLRADAAEDDAAAAVLALEGPPPRSVHRGDSLLSLLDVLEKLPGSLLVWSGATAREAQALSLHDALPSALAILLISPWKLPSSLAGSHIDAGQDNPYRKPRGWVDDISDVEEIAEAAGRNKDALKRAAELELRGGLTDGQTTRLLSAVYWACVRLGDYDRAEEVVRRVSALHPFTGRWLYGNLLRRQGLYAQARAAFESTIADATDATERARAQIELAGVATETADASLAATLYREAISALEGVKDRSDDPRWHSALGRALRDLAALHAEDPARSAECETLVRRALVIHNLDGRFGQVGAALKTRGILERTKGRWDRAEDAFASAAGIFDVCANVGGWAAVIEELSDLAFRMGHYERALVLIHHARARLEPSAPSSRTVLGRLALLEAQVHWRLGSLEKVLIACDEAARLLPPDRVKDRGAVAQLGGLVDSLLGTETLSKRHKKK